MNAPLRRKPTPFQPAPRGADGSLAGFLLVRRAGLGSVAVVLLAIAAGAFVWSRVGDFVRWGDGYQLRPEMVELLGRAPWVRGDLKAEVMRSASLDGGLPLADSELATRLARAFDMHPWVKQVVRVEVKHPARAIVEILCREPVAMVSVRGGLLAVDADGFVLPSADFAPESAAEYPRITGVESSPQGPEGSRWGDSVVEEGASVAVVIGPEWRTLGIVECRPIAMQGTRMWELVGPEGRTILFGGAPGREAAGEPSVAEKIVKLKALEGDTSGQRVDLTTSERRQPSE